MGTNFPRFTRSQLPTSKSIGATSIGAQIITGIVGAAVGSFVGGITGALLFPALGLGSAQQGFGFGAIFGGIGGSYGAIMDKPWYSFDKAKMTWSSSDFAKKYVSDSFRNTLNIMEVSKNIFNFTVPALIADSALISCANSNLMNCNANHHVDTGTGTSP